MLSFGIKTIRFLLTIIKIHTGTCFPGGTQTRVRLCLGPGECDEAVWPGIGNTMELAMCNAFVLCTTTTEAPTTTVATVVPGFGDIISLALSQHFLKLQKPFYSTQLSLLNDNERIMTIS